MRLRRGADVEELHCSEGAVHDDGDMDGTTAAAVTLGQPAETCVEEADEAGVTEHGSVAEERELVAILRGRRCVSMGRRDLVKEDLAGSHVDGRCEGSSGTTLSRGSTRRT